MGARGRMPASRPWAALLALLAALCALGQCTIVQDLAASGNLVTPKVPLPKPSLNISEADSASWTKGVDSQISYAEAELAAAQTRSRSAANAIKQLRAKAESEVKALEAQKANNPKQPRVSRADIDESCGRLIASEQSTLDNSQRIVTK